MKRLVFALFGVFLITESFGQTSLTWTDDIACIIYSHCTSCHHPNGAGHFPLTDYSNAVAVGNALGVAVGSGYMPPWPPNEDYQTYAHERLLTDDERNAIVEWVNNGMPSGDLSQAPVPPTYSNTSALGQVDVTTRMPDYTLPTMTEDEYRCFVLDLNLTQDEWVTGIEVIPGNTNIVHHVLVFSDDTQTPVNLDAQDPGPGYTNFGGTGSNASELISAWVPGSEPVLLPAGMGFPLNPNSRLVIQVHYPMGSTGILDSTRINLKLSPTPLRTVSFDPLLNHITSMQNGWLQLAPNEVKTFHQKYVIPSWAGNRTFLSIAPHAHLICEAMWAFAVIPNGDTIPLVDIPNWDFKWQGQYNFRSPLKLPAGTELHGYARYNNTASNPNNPSNPPVQVNLGDATTDEMMLFYFAYLPYQSGDESIVIDGTTHTPHYLNCQSATVDLPEVERETLEFYPNPTTDRFFWKDSSAREGQYRIVNLMGQTVQDGSWMANEGIRVSGLAAGSYWVEISDHDQWVYTGTITVSSP